MRTVTTIIVLGILALYVFGCVAAGVPTSVAQPSASPTTLPAAVAAAPTGLTGAEVLSTIQQGLAVAQVVTTGTPASVWIGLATGVLGLLAGGAVVAHGNSVNATTSQAATAAMATTHAATVSNLTSLLQTAHAALLAATPPKP